MYGLSHVVWFSITWAGLYPITAKGMSDILTSSPNVYLLYVSALTSFQFIFDSVKCHLFYRIWWGCFHILYYSWFYIHPLWFFPSGDRYRVRTCSFFGGGFLTASEWRKDAQKDSRHSWVMEYMAQLWKITGLNWTPTFFSFQWSSPFWQPLKRSHRKSMFMCEWWEMPM